MRIDVIHSPTRAVVDDSLAGLAITGAVIVSLSIIRNVKQPVIARRTHSLDDQRVGVEVVQQQAPISREMCDRFSNRDLASGAVDVALAGIVLARATAAYGGASALSRVGAMGSVVRLTCRSLQTL